MARRCFSMLVALLTMFWLAGSCLGQVPTITSVAPSSGSTAGGTRLTIIGTNFAGDNFLHTVTVLIGPISTWAIPCVVITYYSTSTQIICDTGPTNNPNQVGTFTVTVVRDNQGTLVGQLAKGFTYSASRTPSIDFIQPGAASPGSLVTIGGNYPFGSQYTDFLKVAFGNFLCAIPDSGATITSSPENTVGCYLRSNGDGWAPGSFNVTVQQASLYAPGNAVVPQRLLSTDYTGTPYNFQLFADVTAVTPSIGSTAGGSLLTVTGMGFPSTAAFPGAISVTVGGSPCAVKFANFTTLLCLTSAAPASANVSNAQYNITANTPAGTTLFYPGGRGVSMEYFNQSTNTADADKVGTSAASFYAKSSNGRLAPNVSAVLGDYMEMPGYQYAFYTPTPSNHIARLRSFFTAPVTGNYTFYLSSDDDGVLYAGALGVNASAAGTLATVSLIASVSGWTAPRDYLRYATQVSASVNLTAGSVVWLEAVSHQGNGALNAAVGVRFTGSGTVLPTTVAEVQRITLTDTGASLGGSFTISWNGYTTSYLATSASSATVATALNALVAAGGNAGAVAVSTVTTYSASYTWDVTFNPLLVPGYQNMSINTASLTGAGTVSATVIRMQAYSTDWNFKAIPAEFLRLPVTTPNIVQVRNSVTQVSVNGFLSSASGGLNATFAYSSAATPALTAITPVTGGIGSAVNITGSGFTATAGTTSVMVAGAPCAITTNAGSYIVCTVGAGPAGNGTVQVTAGSAGLAAVSNGSSVAFRLTSLNVTAVSPYTIGSGINVLTISGTGFSSASSGQTVVSLGGVACSLLGGGYFYLLASCDSTSLGSGILNLNVTSGTDSTITAGYTVTLATSAPYLSSFSPTSASSAVSSTLYLTGANFNFTGYAALTLVSALFNLSSVTPVLDSSATPAASSSVLASLGALSTGAAPTAQCAMSSSTLVLCYLSQSATGNFSAYLTFPNGMTVGLSGSTLSLSLTMSAVSPALGSIAGGTILTITGTGFSTNPNLVAAFVTVPVSTTWPNKVVPCDVINSTSTTITCTTRAHCAADSSAADPNAQRCSMRSSSFVSISLAMCRTQPTGALTDLDRLECWAATTTPKATCSASSGGCSFAYSWALTPEICTVSPSSSTLSNSTLVLTGPTAAQLAVRPTHVGSFVNAPSVYFGSGGLNGSTVSVNSTGAISVTLPTNLTSGTYQLVVSDGNITAAPAAVYGSSCVSEPGPGLTVVNPSPSFLYQSQVIMSPIVMGSGGGLNLTLTVTNGGSFSVVSGVVTVVVGSGSNYVSCAVNYINATFLSCLMPARTAGVSGSLSVDSNLLMDIAVNGTYGVASCSGGCYFKYSSAITPVFSSVSPTSVSAAGTSVTLTGTGFSATASDHTVTLSSKTSGNGGFSCPVTASTSTTVTCTVPSLPADTYSFNVLVLLEGLTTGTSPTLTSNLALSSISPTSGSLYGGLALTINGYGFAFPNLTASNATGASCWNNAVTVSGQACAITSQGYSSIVCTTPSLGTVTSAAVTVTVSEKYCSSKAAVKSTSASYSSLSYAAAKTPALATYSNLTWTQNSATGVSLYWGAIAGLPTPSGVYVDGVYSNCSSQTNATSTSLNCTMPAVAAGAHSIQLLFAGFGFSNPLIANVSLSLTSSYPALGSAGGGLNVTILGSGFALDITANNVTIGGSPCIVVNSTSTMLSCVTGASSIGSSAVNIIVTVGAGYYTAALAPANGTLSSAFTYSSAYTPTITAMSPTRGSTAGGTSVTLTGTLFTGAAGITVPTVTLAGFPCVVGTYSATSIVCVTSAPSPKPLGAFPVLLAVPGMGLATSNVTNSTRGATWEYVDLWSRNTTWGGSPPPGAGDSVYIPANTTVLLDINPPQLVLIIIAGTLKFDDSTQDINLGCTYIMINGGAMIIGSAASPYARKATVTLYGSLSTPQLPQYGSKVIAVRDGTLQMFGQPRTPTWSKLNATANVGDSYITIIDVVVGWKVGDRIVIASSSVLPGDVDEAVIVSLSANATGTTLYLDRPLAFTHLGVIASVAGTGRTIDMRAEVGIMSRDIVVQGDPSSVSSQFGAQIFMHGSGASGTTTMMQLSQIEVLNCGQAYQLGRYCVHFHLNGYSPMSFLADSSVHNSYNRACTIHGVSGVQVQRNLAYYVMGMTFFVEDGIEYNNTIEGNLAVLTRVSNSLLNVDTTPASFWITNPNNTVRNNVAAGSEAYGYWYNMENHPTGPSATNSICPKGLALMQFENNTAHSNIFYGLRIWPEYYPDSDVTGCSGVYFPGYSSTATPAVFSGLLSYKNGLKGAITENTGRIVFRNFTIADCGAGPQASITNGKDNGGGIELAFVMDNRNRANVALTNMAGIDTALIVARTAEGNVGTAGYWPSNRGLRAIMTNSNPVGGSTGSFMSVRNVVMSGWTGSQFYGLEACAKCQAYRGGFTTYFANTVFINPTYATANIASWSWPHQGVFVDTDGTLIGNGNGAIVAAYNPLLASDGCSTAWSGVVNGAVCGEFNFSFHPLNLILYVGDAHGLTLRRAWSPATAGDQDTPVFGLGTDAGNSFISSHTPLSVWMALGGFFLPR